MYLLEVEPLDLGEDVKAVGLELIEPENREPVRGADAAGGWLFAALRAPGIEIRALVAISLAAAGFALAVALGRAHRRYSRGTAGTP